MPSTLTDKLNAAFGCFQNRDAPGTERLCNDILRESPGHPEALHLLGMLRMVAGDPAAAAGLLRRSLEGNARDASTHEHLGIALLATGDGAAAEAALAQARALGADHAQLHMGLGLALAAQGKLPAAVSSLRTAAAREPGDLDIQLNLGNTLAQHGQFEEALPIYEKVLQAQPNNATVWFNLGNLYGSMERLDEAASAYNKALAAAPGDADTHSNLGLLYQRQHRLEEAAGHYQQALVLDANHTHARNNLGNVLREQGKHNEAVACYEQVLERQPGHFDALMNLGIVRAEQGSLDDAQALYERALRADPHAVEGHRNLGTLYKIQGRLKDAAACYRKALELAPQQKVIYGDLGGVLRDSGELDLAAAAYREAVDGNPQSALLHYELAEILKGMGRYDEAIAGYERALVLQPDYHRALGGLLYVRQIVCDWSGIEASWERLRSEGLGKTNSGISPFSIMHMPFGPEEQLACAQEWARHTLGRLAAARTGSSVGGVPRAPHPRMRVGYLSWDFHEHATSYLMAELFELHDRARFEVHTYSYGPNDGSAIRARIQAASEHFVDVAGASFSEIAQRIRDDGIDVLVDLKGYTMASRPQVLALRPAPVQVNWLGYPGTMGTDCVDYILADPFIIPEGAERHYAEEVVRLPHCYQVNDRKREISSVLLGRADCGLPAVGLVFCSFNQNTKLLPDVFAAWMRILLATPGSVLWLLETNQRATDNLRRSATQHGVAPERLIFAARKPMPVHIARYRVADLALDTFPYTSHTTASDALWAGCPLVTRAGTTFASRVAASLLINAGLGELVTENQGDYERLILELAHDPERLRSVRAKLQETRDSCPLFDTPRFVLGLERAYEAMFSAGQGRRS